MCIGIVLFESVLRLVENGYKIQRNKQNIKNTVQAVFQGGGGRKILSAQTLKEL